MSPPAAVPIGTRQRNLSLLLRLLHVEGPLARAALTRATGWNRSTTADLVGDLVDRGLAAERAPDPARRAGRPSPVVAAAGDVVAIAANPEVDALEIAAIGLDRAIRLRERIDVDHPMTPTEAVDLISARIESWRAGPLRGARVVSAGAAVPGLVRAADGLVREAPHLGWIDTPLGDMLSSATGLPVVVGNDAGLGTLAEHLFGAGRDIADLVYLNGGASGIGGGLVVGGMPVGGAAGYAGEFGQNRPGIDVEADRRTAGGVLEDEVSRRRLLDAVALTSADEPTLAAALHAPDAPAAEELGRQRRILATALGNAVNVLNPAVIVLGGFLASIAALDLDALTAAVRSQAMSPSAEGLEIRVAALGEDRLLLGAAEAAFAALLKDPASISAR